MKITKTEVTKIELTELDRLDPVQVIAEDLGSGRGKITVSCYGKSWTNFWGGMGAQTIIEFVTTCNTDYLAEKFSTLHKWETDWDRINEELDLGFVGSAEEATAYLYDAELGAQYGEGGDWRLNLPSRITTDYAYLCRVIEAMKSGLIELLQEEAA